VAKTSRNAEFVLLLCWRSSIELSQN